jgi:CHAD domain-containing protein
MSAGKGDGKWVDGLTSDMAVGKAARKALEARLDAVRAALDPAKELTADGEPVHQMRVATRRATAALQVFGGRLPGKAEKRARKVLRKLRRAAAPAREADVLLAALDGWAADRPDAEKAGMQFLFGLLMAERRAAQTNVRDAIEKCGSKWASLLEHCPRHVRRGGPPLGELAEKVYHGFVRDLDAAIAACDFDDDKKLHALRIAGKRLRYAYELLAGALDPEIETTLYPSLVELQSILGTAHDTWQIVGKMDRVVVEVTALRPQILPSIRSGLCAFRAEQREQFSGHKAAFTTWRRTWPAKRV